MTEGTIHGKTLIQVFATEFEPAKFVDLMAARKQVWNALKKNEDKLKKTVPSRKLKKVKQRLP